MHEGSATVCPMGSWGVYKGGAAMVGVGSETLSRSNNLLGSVSGFEVLNDPTA